MEKTLSDVVAIAREYLKPVSVDGIIFAADIGFSERTPYGWHIGVHPTRYPRRMYVLYEELAIVAQEIAEETGLNIFFVVGEPLEKEEDALVNAA